jgi:hypothetical protein
MRAHIDAHLHSSGAVQNSGGHDSAMFGKCISTVLAMLPANYTDLMRDIGSNGRFGSSRHWNSMPVGALDANGQICRVLPNMAATGAD